MYGKWSGQGDEQSPYSMRLWRSADEMVTIYVCERA